MKNPHSVTNILIRRNIIFYLKKKLYRISSRNLLITLLSSPTQWRWYVFEKGPIGMNSRWWNLRLKESGIIPPVSRSMQHFDAAAKYHVISDQDYIKYFVATVLQFQIYSELCSAANHIGPLHTCDFYRSREAGRLLR